MPPSARSRLFYLALQLRDNSAVGHYDAHLKVRQLAAAAGAILVPAGSSELPATEVRVRSGSRFGLLSASFLVLGCVSGMERRSQDPPSAVAIGPSEGTELWFQPSDRDEVGRGAVLTLKIDRISVPDARLMAATQRLGADGIPVHAHTFEDELLYVVAGSGFAVVGSDREEIPLEPGSLLYVPPEEWHGVRNADPDARMEILLVTTPSKPGGLADFFRHASSRPGHPPLDLPEERLLELFHEYGMRVPAESPSR